MTHKTCNSCGDNRRVNYFFRVNNETLFPDGRISTCRDCVRRDIDVEDLQQVISFLRQLDKPFYDKEWQVALDNKDKRHPIGSYLGKINSLPQYRDKTFEHSDGIVKGTGNIDLSEISPPGEIETLSGETVEYEDSLIDKWGLGYSQKEYLELEKFYRDMRVSYEINTPMHIDMLKQLSYLSVDRNKLRIEGDWANYKRVSDTHDAMMRSAGFRPADRQGIDDQAGIRSFSQIFEEVEKNGFRKAPPIEFEHDVIDGIIIALSNYYHRIVGKEILTDMPEEMANDLENFYPDQSLESDNTEDDQKEEGE